MKRTSRPAGLPVALAAVLVLALGLLAGCGGSDSSDAAATATETTPAATESTPAAGGAPADASVQDFCGTFLDLIQQASQAGSNTSDAQSVKLAKDAADQLEAVGTPADMPADARRAFEKAIELIHSIPDDATRKEMDAIAADLTKSQQSDLQALTEYVTQKCMGGGVPSGSSSGSGSSSPAG